MLLTIKNDNGEVVKEIKLNALVGVGFVDIPNSNEEGILTLIEGAGTPSVSYAARFLDVYSCKKMNELLENARPAQEMFEKWEKER